MNCSDIWDRVMEIVDVGVECLNQIILGLMDLICPAKRVRVSGRPPPWCHNSTFRSLRHARDRAHRDIYRSALE